MTFLTAQMNADLLAVPHLRPSGYFFNFPTTSHPSCNVSRACSNVTQLAQKRRKEGSFLYRPPGISVPGYRLLRPLLGLRAYLHNAKTRASWCRHLRGSLLGYAYPGLRPGLTSRRASGAGFCG